MMMSGGFTALFVLFVLVVIGIAVVGYLGAKARREEFSAYAVSKGWRWVARDDSWTRAFSGDPFESGHNKQAKNVITGTYDGRPFVAMDYVFHTTETSSNGNGGTTSREVSHPYSITAIDTAIAFPDLSVSPEGFLGRMAGRITGRDIELESEDFNRAFTVHADDRKFASDVLHPRMMESLLRNPGAAFRFTGTWVLSAYRGRHELAELEARIALIDHVIDQVPDFVLRERGGQA